MTWHERVRETGSSTTFVSDCAMCVVDGCPDRTTYFNSWGRNEKDHDRDLRQYGPPDHFTMTNPDCGCDECIAWGSRFYQIHDCRDKRCVSHVVFNRDKADYSGPIGKYNDGDGIPQQEYALHYTYWLNIPDLIHNIKENDFAANRDAMFDKLSKKWPHVDIISVEEVRS